MTEIITLQSKILIIYILLVFIFWITRIEKVNQSIHSILNFPISVIDKILIKYKSLFITSSKYPIIKEVAELSVCLPYHYDTVYEVYQHWDSNIEVTKNTFMIAGFLHVDPLGITKESMSCLQNALCSSGISMEDAANGIINAFKYINNSKN